MNHKKRFARRRRFTLIEVVVVIVILVTLAGIATPMYMEYVKRAKTGTAQTQIKLLKEAVNMYKLDVGKNPSELRCLIENLDDSDKWRGPYLDTSKIPLDPWNNEYIYVTPGEHGDFDLSSYGADGQPGGEKDNADINSWE